MEKKKGGAVVITGASTGIGAACALRLDGRGYRVFAGVRKLVDGEALEGKASTRLRHLILDVTDHDTIAKAVETVAMAVGDDGIAGLVNNAGIVLAGSLEFLPLDELRRQFETNVIGQIAVTQAFLPLIRQASGRVINMGSSTARVTPPFLGPYGASKRALDALTDALRLELRPWGIHVSAVEPGAVRTPIWDKSRSMAEALAAHYPEDGQHLYDNVLDALRVGLERISRFAIPPEKVAVVVERALSTPRPKARYMVGFDARAQALLHWAIPVRLQDFLVRAALGLPR